MIKRIVLLLLALTFFDNVIAQAPSDNIVGIWLNEDKTHKIEIFKVGSTYTGKIVWLSTLESNPKLQPKDKNNPDAKLRNRNILGMEIITGLQFLNGKWVNGTIYAPKKGIYANCEVELLSNQKLKVIVSKSGFTKTQIWTRK
jgi:uncharacterized protein (DUF2147 family)